MDARSFQALAAVVSQADYTDHLVFAPGTLGQCKAR